MGPYALICFVLLDTTESFRNFQFAKNAKRMFHLSVRATRLPQYETLSQAQRLQTLDRLPVLVLNRDYAPLSYMPLSTWPWQDAIKAVWQDRVDVLNNYEYYVRSARYEMLLPAVVVLKQYEPRLVSTPRLSKRLLYLRDDGRCQYCNTKSMDLTLDHVLPRSKGGKSDWDNVVLACRSCNAKKRNFTPNQLKSIGMNLRRLPQRPSPFQLENAAKRKLLHRINTRGGLAHESWATYLQEHL
uniref:HNH nuclease domain-containing protein n=1 Tax=Aureoumbra lagunensis TaxID=44058 RepID=A0A7S3K3Z1_9STRA